MNDLEKFFNAHTGRTISKWMHYFDIYERFFSQYRNKEVIILEIGVFKGGSLQMWKNYFGPKAKIYGIDIDPKCKEFEEENIEIFIGSQSDRKFLQEIRNKIPPIDILIDDGGHEMQQQIITFEELYDYVKEDGIYLCEDTHTSYWKDFGGGYKRKGSFIEFSKELIDLIHAYHSHSKKLAVNDFTRSADSIHFYDSIVVIEKKRHDNPPHARITEIEGIIEASVMAPKRGLEHFVTKKLGSTQLFKKAKEGSIGNYIRKKKEKK